MRILLFVLLPILGINLSMSEVKVEQKIVEVDGATATANLTGKATYFAGEFCDHNTEGIPVKDVQGVLTELTGNIVHEVIADGNGEFCYPAINDGLISYEGILPNRFYTDHILTSPVLGVAAFDIGKIHQYIVGNASLCSFTKLAADVNCDGQIDQTDLDLIQERLSATTLGYVPPFPCDNWMIVPKLSMTPSLTHPDVQYLSDFWNPASPADTDNDYPFDAVLDVMGDHYEYAPNPNSWKGKIEQWGYSNEINNCDASLDFYVGKKGEVTAGGANFNQLLNGSYAGSFGITCNTPDDERYFDVIPYQGGYLAVGEALSSTAGNQMDVLITKMNKYAEIIWSKTIGGTGDDLARSVIETTDGNFFITASSKSITVNREDLYVIKMDADGVVLFENSFEGTNDSQPSPGAFAKGIQTSDGGYLLGGYSSNILFSGSRSCYVLKLDGNGALQWTKNFGFFSDDWINSIIETQDGGFVFAGNTENYGVGFNDILLVKLNASGNVIWQKAIGTTSNDEAGSVIELSNGNLILCGALGEGEVSNNTISKGFIMELNGSGTEIWSKVYYGGKKDIVRQVIPISNGYIALASSNSFVSNDLNDAILFRITNDGTTIWTQQYGEEGKDDILLSAYKINDFQFIFGGYTKTAGMDWDTYMLKTDDFGKTYIDCHIEQPLWSTDNANFSFTTTTLGQSISFDQTAFSGVVSAFEFPCSRYCGENGTPPVTTLINDAAENRRTQNRDIEGNKKISVSIQTKYPITAFGFELTLDPSIFSITNVRKNRNELTTNMSASNFAQSNKKGVVRVLSYSGKENNYQALDCSRAKAILEIQGELLKNDSALKDHIVFNENNFPIEFISEGKVLAPEDYEITFDWGH